MASLTSLYLCSRTVYAAVGSPTARGARITAAASTQLPEGCLINGVITNEADLAEALKAFFADNKLPTGRVALIAGGSQFMHRIMELPAMSEKKRLAVLSHELSSSGAETTAPLDDYMLLSRDAKTRTDTVLATRVEQSVIAGYDALAKDAGFKLTCIDLGLAAPIKAVRTIPALQNGTFVVLQFDDDTISACLFVQGQYTYSTRSRLFNPRGTAESGTEIAQKLSGLVQFHIASKSEHQIDTVYFAGADAKDFTVCRPGCEALALKVEQFPDSPTVSLPKGTALADVLYAAGNLIAR
jgi:Tfp pilus assembly PilM family ATPase